MLNRLKRTLVDSFVGAIGLGYLFAETILSFTAIFSAPVGAWAGRSTYQGLLGHTFTSTRFPYEAGVPELVRFLVLLVVWYVLLRWLYFTPIGKNPVELTTSPVHNSQS
jgi:hypothetical protein